MYYTVYVKKKDAPLHISPKPVGTVTTIKERDALKKKYKDKGYNVRTVKSKKAVVVTRSK